MPLTDRSARSGLCCRLSCEVAPRCSLYANPYDNAKAESFMKTLKFEAVYLMDYETSPAQFEDHHARQRVKTAA